MDSATYYLMGNNESSSLVTQVFFYLYNVAFSFSQLKLLAPYWPVLSFIYTTE